MGPRRSMTENSDSPYPLAQNREGSTPRFQAQADAIIFDHLPGILSIPNRDSPTLGPNHPHRLGSPGNRSWRRPHTRPGIHLTPADTGASQSAEVTQIPLPTKFLRRRSGKVCSGSLKIHLESRPHYTSTVERASPKPRDHAPPSSVPQNPPIFRPPLPPYPLSPRFGPRQ